ncbi:EFR1 family ferrodoxin [Vallitalea sp.]|uniref:EFR1 family ferrodoxin n=1 Tax=Vallitalea sp. TaxID=1882829 RepID=UPI0025EED76C|nr:EFR1 family ferrodoxin [Vallitalea sp.]MCT4688468.1 EFR1 family ferrodoxin [Vallitalea sp.]
MKILIAFFSATGNTKKIATVIKNKLKELGVNVTSVDITSYSSRQKELKIDEYDGIFFGFPIYSMRAPRICREWLHNINGKGKKCSVFFTYGGFGKDPAHYYTKQILDENNFKLVSSAEFVSAHTFNYSGWLAAQNRPNQSDYKIAEEYTVKTINKFITKEAYIPIEYDKPIFSSEQLDQAEKYRFHVITKLPTRDGVNCSMCGLCENICPTKAMDAEKGLADLDSCISCFRCIANCPDQVLHTNNISNTWEKKLEFHKTTKEGIDRMVSKIYI